MNKKITTAIALCIFGSAGAAIAQTQAGDRSAPTSASTAGAPAADNTAVNERDKSSHSMTSTDQPNDSADIRLAAAVRKAIVDDKSLSTTGHNVKLVAAKGTVTLRGPVQNDAEKAKVAQIAAGVAGVSRVDNQIDVKSE